MKIRLLLAGMMLMVSCGLVWPAGTSAQLDSTEQDTVCQQNPDADFCQERAEGRQLFGSDGLVTRIAQIISLLAGAIAVIMIVIAGFRFVTSSGNADAIGGARDSIIYAVIGLAVAATAQILVAFVLSRLG